MRGPSAQRSAEGGAAPAAQVDARDRARHRVEAGGEDQRVEREALCARLDAGRRDALERRLAQIDQPHVRPVVRGVVARVHAQPLAAHHVVRRERLGQRRVRHELLDLAADELGRGLVGVPVEQQIRIAAQEGEPAARPALLVLRLALFGRRIHRELLVEAHVEGEGHLAPELAQLAVGGLGLAHGLGVQGPVVGRHRVVRRALEDGEGGRLLGEDRDRLDRRGPGADHAHAFSREVDGLVGPASGVIGLAGERLEAGDARRVRRGEAARGEDHVLRRHAVAIARAHRPAAGRFVEVRRLDARGAADVAPQVEAVRHVVQVAEDLRLRGVELAPLPLLLQLLRPLVGVLEALHVAARAGVAVPEPGAADAAPGFEHEPGEPDAAQAMEHVEAGEAGAHDHGVAPLGRCGGGGHASLHVGCIDHGVAPLGRCGGEVMRHSTSVVSIMARNRRSRSCRLRPACGRSARRPGEG